jgi:sugar transferase (PEP-CTERM/EpsH1 system associated)
MLLRTEDSIDVSPAAHGGAAALDQSPNKYEPPPLRVLHVLDHLDTGGTEYGVLKVVNGFPQTQFDSRICVMRGSNTELVNSAALRGRIFHAGGASEGSQMGILRLGRIFRAWRPHIVHSRNWGAIEAIPAARWTNVPVAIHSEHGYELDMLKGLPLRRRLLRRGFYHMADAVFAVSRDLSSYHARQVGWNNGRISTIYNGVDTNRFAPRTTDRRLIREQFGLPEGRFVIGMAGRLVAIKSYPTVLKAAVKLLEMGYDISVLVVGAGPERKALEQGASQLGERAIFLGERHDLPVLYNAMDVFVQSSICEGMSNTLLEAMASGVPVVATRVGGNPELVQDETTGFLFSPGDVAALGTKLALLAKSPSLCQQLGESARQRAQTEFGLSQMLAAYERLYMSLAARRGWSAGR